MCVFERADERERKRMCVCADEREKRMCVYEFADEREEENLRAC